MTTMTRYRCLTKDCYGLTTDGPGFCETCTTLAAGKMTMKKDNHIGPFTKAAIGLAKPARHCETDGCMRAVIDNDTLCLFCQHDVKPPQPKPAPTMDAVVEANRALLLYRSQVGIAKYNTTLSQARLTHRQILQHALEEALDLANYLQTQIMQMDAAQQ